MISYRDQCVCEITWPTSSYAIYRSAWQTINVTRRSRLTTSAVAIRILRPGLHANLQNGSVTRTGGSECLKFQQFDGGPAPGIPPPCLRDNGDVLRPVGYHQYGRQPTGGWLWHGFTTTYRFTCKKTKTSFKTPRYKHGFLANFNRPDDGLLWKITPFTWTL